MTHLSYPIKMLSPSILLVIPNLGLGGAQRVFHDHSVEFARYHTVSEIVFNLDDGDLYPSGNPVYSLNVSGGGSPVDKLRNFGRRVRGLRQLREQLRPSVCISHLEGADYVNLLSGGPGKTVLCIHGSKLYDANISGAVGWLRKKALMPLLYNRADKIVTVSRDIVAELVNVFGVEPEKIQTINNFFEVARIEQASWEPLLAAEAAVYAAGPVLVTSGRLTVQKNQAPLLNILVELRRRLLPVRLIFVGDGELRDSLVANARSLGLRVFAAWEGTALTPEFDVYFLGLQQNPFKYLRPATAFVFPSAWEGFPMALGEAMVCGLPVLSTDCATGPREMLAPATVMPANLLRQAEWTDCGVLLPMLNQLNTLSSDKAIWVETLAELLAAPDRREQLGQLARQRMNDFTREHIFGQWLQLVEDLC